MCRPYVSSPPTIAAAGVQGRPVQKGTAISRTWWHSSPTMNIGIIGAGRMGSALGTLWTKRGHEVMFSYSRSRTRLQDLALGLGSNGHSGTPREAVGFADVLLLAVPWERVEDALSSAGSLGGRTLISCVNPIGAGGLEVGLTSSAAEEISRQACGAFVVEAFNTVLASVLPSAEHLFGRSAPTVFYCGDDRDSKKIADQLIRDAGLQPVDAGPLESARRIEPIAMLMADLVQSHATGSEVALRLMGPQVSAELLTSADSLARDFVGAFGGESGRLGSGTFLAEDFVAYVPYTRSAIRGRSAFVHWIGQFRMGLSEFRCDLNEFVGDGMRVALRWTWSGIHSGELLGLPASGRRVEFTETHILRVSGGRIAEDRVSANLVDLYEQLGHRQWAAA